MNSRITAFLLFTMLSHLAFAEHEGFCSSDFESECSIVNSEEINCSCYPYSSSRPNLKEGLGLSITGEFLYWKPEEGGLEYALQTPNNGRFGNLAQPNPLKGVSGKVSRIETDYEPGYRITGSYQLPHDQWDLCFRWTKHKSNSCSTLSQKDDEVIFPFFMQENFSPTCQSAKAKWMLNFNTLELNLRRSLCLSNHFSIAPFAGFQAAWINQKILINYYDIIFAPGLLNEGGIRSKTRNNFQGYGINLGLEGKIDFCWGFNLFGRCKAALLLGDFYIAEFEKNIAVSPRGKLKEQLNNMVSPELEIVAGISWEHQFSDNNCYINIFAAFEEQLWFDQNHINRFTDTFSLGRFFNVGGNLTLSGLTLGATVGF